jgi:hypothetical protein
VNNQTTSDPVRATPAAQPPSDQNINYELLDLLEKWRTEDATDDPELIRAAERELAEFMESLNRNRIEAGELPLFP